MKKIRVYDPRGDFTLDIPDDAEVTFGYFNPAAAAPPKDPFARTSYDGPGGSTMKTTALRIYEMRGKKKHQIGCFLGVTGFRDEQLVLTKLSQKVIIETNLTDDGEGNIDSAYNQRRQITATPEPGSYR